MKTNLFERVPPACGSETVETLLTSKHVRIEKIVSNRASTSWYDQDEAEWVVLLDGEAELQLEEQSVMLRKGDALLIEAHLRHRVLSTSEDALWLTVFFSAK